MPTSAQVTWYVDPDAPGTGTGASWENAFTDLQPALIAALSNLDVTEIRVAEGHYVPTTDPLNHFATFSLRSELSVLGGHAGFGEPDPDLRSPNSLESVLSGDALGNDGSYELSDCCFDRVNEAGCDDSTCSAAVCAADPSCCSNGLQYPEGWRGWCTDLAESLCGELCTFNEDNVRHVVTARNVDATAVLDGFTIQGGNARGSSTNDRRGGGMFVRTADPTVSFCTFQKNSGQHGAGVFLLLSESATYLSCQFRKNVSEGWGGAALIQLSHPHFNTCQFQENYAVNSGGAIANDSSSEPLFRECLFISNRASLYGYGGAMQSTGGSRPSVVRSAFVDNQAHYGGAISIYAWSGNRGEFVQCVFALNRANEFGGAIFDFGNTILVGAIIAGNKASRGAGIYSGELGAPHQLTATQCTVVGNLAAELGGGIYDESTQAMRFHNSILWSNSAGESLSTESAQMYTTKTGPEVLYSIVEGWTGGFGGRGNSGLNPLFRDPLGIDGIAVSGDEDLRLSLGSPAIDNGSNGLIPSDTLDVDGNFDTGETLPWDYFGHARIRDGDGIGGAAVDIGIFEYQGTELGDCNHDNAIDAGDLFYLSACFGGPRISLDGDLNDSRYVGADDFALMEPCVGGPEADFDQGCEASDRDADGDVDLADYAEWSRLVGDRWAVGFVCECLDMDGDFDIDLHDFAIWTRVYDVAPLLIAPTSLESSSEPMLHMPQLWGWQSAISVRSTND